MLRATTTTAGAPANEDDHDECVIIKFVTGNAMKLREVEEILGMNGLPLPLEMIDIDLDELQESQPEKIAAREGATIGGGGLRRPGDRR